MMKESVTFYKGQLVDKDGKKVMLMSTSPENGYLKVDKRYSIAEYTAMTQELLIILFNSFVKSCEILNVDNALKQEIKDNKALAVLVVLLGMALASFAVFNVSGYGNMGVGWTLDGVNFLGGTLRMLFPFSLGMLMSRNFKPMKVNGAFWICTIILIALFSVPYLEGLEPICMNGIYEAFCVIAVFPFLVWLGASGTTTDKQSTKICKFLGDISYPVYVVHYPLMYLFYAWLIENKLYTLGETWYVAVGVFVLSVILACLCLKLYDEPVRKWLSKKFLAPK